MGLIRQSLAVVTIGAVKPESRKQRTARKALAALEPQPGNYVNPRTTDCARASVVELAARSEQAERSL
jgi:hypothetical protein